MKRLFIVLILLVGSTNLFAQADTLFVPVLDPNAGEFLNEVIANDNQAHAVYQLVKGETYWINGPIVSSGFHVNIVGEPVSIRDEQPATIRPAILADGTIPDSTFDTFGDLTLKNLNVWSVGPLGQTQQEVALVKGDGARITIDNCIFEGNNEFGFRIFGRFIDLFVKNTIFRNNQNLGGWYNGRGFWVEAPADTVEIINCTFVNMGAYIYTDLDRSTQFLRFEHNSVVNIQKTPFFLHQQHNSVVSHNLFYNADFIGQNDTELNGGWDDFDLQNAATISLDTLNATVDALLDSITGGDFTEADRRVEVRNNAYFWEQAFVDFWNSADTLHGPVWMNDRTQAMFADDASYPLLIAENNVNVAATFAQGPGTQAAQLTHITSIRQPASEPGHPDPVYWGIGGDQTQQPFPLPEDLSFTDTALLTHADGDFPVGDLNWFGLVDEWEDFITGVDDDDLTRVPEAFDLLQNYPNPFNPSTTIEYTVDAPGKVSLKIYNLQGQLIKTVLNNVTQSYGVQKVKVDMADAASGIYFYVVQIGDRKLAKKMTLMK